MHLLLTDTANIGVLTILKTTHVLKENGKKTIKPNVHKKTIPDGLPAIVPHELYELAQVKLKTNRSDKSHPPRNPEDFLLRGHVFCKSCGYRILGRYRTSRKIHVYPYYGCVHHNNKYAACPDPPLIRTPGVDEYVWADCCRVFQRLELIREVLERNIEQSLQNLLEDTQGRVVVAQLEEEITYAKKERDKHPEGSYYHTLISHDIREKEERLQRCREEYTQSSDIVRLSGAYRKSVMGFLDFLDTMKGRYHEASFKEKRNALNVLGVKVVLHPATEDYTGIREIDTEKEWLTVKEMAAATGISSQVIGRIVIQGRLAANRNVYPMLIYREEINRFLRESPVRTRELKESIPSRVEITYTPLFTGVQSSLG